MQRMLKVRLLKIHGGDQEPQPNDTPVLGRILTPAATSKTRAIKLADNQILLQGIRTAQIALLNNDLAREYNSVVSSLLCSQVAQSSRFFNSAAELERHAAEEIHHTALIEAEIEALGGISLDPTSQVHLFANADGMFRFDQIIALERVTHFRLRIRQCEGTGMYAIAAIMRVLLVQEQDHQLAMTDALQLDDECHGTAGNGRPAQKARIKGQRCRSDLSAARNRLADDLALSNCVPRMNNSIAARSSVAEL